MTFTVESIGEATVNAYETAQRLGFTGTDQQIVDQLRATGLTEHPIQLSELLMVLNIPFKMLYRLPRADSDGSKWAGTLFNLMLYVNANGTQEQKDGLNQFFSHITNDRNVTFDTTNVGFSSQFWAVAQQFGGVGNGMPSAEDFAAVAALGGGWLFADLTVEEYERQRLLAESTIDPSLYDCLLSINRTNGVLRVSMNVQREGQQIRLAMLTEGEGSEADQALTSAIETVIDNWLQAGG